MEIQNGSLPKKLEEVFRKYTLHIMKECAVKTTEHNSIIISPTFVCFRAAEGKDTSAVRVVISLKSFLLKTTLQDAPCVTPSITKNV